MEPTLAGLVAYAEAANCYLEVLARDDLSLGPGPLPYREKHHGTTAGNQKRPAKKKAG